MLGAGLEPGTCRGFFTVSFHYAIAALAPRLQRHVPAMLEPIDSNVGEEGA